MDPSALRPLVMVAVFGLILILPVRLNQKGMLGLAFILWLTGGLMLSWLGLNRVMGTPESYDTMTLVIALAIALIIGFGKGKFVLGKTSQKNIERIQAFSENQLMAKVYSKRSWIVIAVMMALAIGINTLGTIPDFYRGVVNIAIGFALMVSSLAYIQALQTSEKEPAPSVFK